MKKQLTLLFLLLLSTATAVMAQSRGIKIGYIDMEYILDKVPAYAEAKNQLDQKAEKWKQEIETKKNDIAKLKEALKTERVLLTKELIEEREEEIAFQEKELIDYQQKRFGPNGDLVVQKATLVKPIQDQVFNAVQDLAEARKFDYVFDKSSDITILFAAKKHDLSDRVISVLTRAERRQQMSKKQIKEEEEKERKEDMIADNPEMSERQKQMEERKAARLKLIEEKKQAAEDRKKAADEKRKQQLEEKNNKKTGTVSDTAKTTTADKPSATDKKEEDKAKVEETKAAREEAKNKSLEERKKQIEDRKKAADEKRKQQLEAREAAKKAKDSIRTSKP
ncbi:OmpH family outer membrane protein [Flavobacterium stagni]|uniref:OmpH family outer membrane protein n=1 Tax=Flavobacterium stagni TaxID=2506421 RepID=A0A4Q1KBP2_9FLAO|nr:OmpH family outer membrane protein [Flavobacterium stagni]RXR24031.1 OmpH family outer membrane protein [Flavobacterium stagni]